MAKYLDQTGAQHLAEALMASTKTIGGQTIWGSGNIEAGGGIKTYHITGDQEWLNNAEALASPEFKVVILDNTTGTIGSTADTNYVLCNAIVTNNTPANMDYISIGSDATATFYFINCSFVNNGMTDTPEAIVPYGCELSFQNSGFYFKNCNLKLTEPSASDHLFINCRYLYMTNCELRCLKGGYLVQTRLSCMDSIIYGLKLASDSSIYIRTGNSMDVISHCTFETMSGIVPSGTNSAQNTIIEWCNLYDARYTNTLYNVKYCKINSQYTSRCHPYILTTQAVDNTAAGGFNTII